MKILFTIFLFLIFQHCNADHSASNTIDRAVKNILSVKFEIENCKENIDKNNYYLNFYKDNFTPEFGALLGWTKSCPFYYKTRVADQDYRFRKYEILTGVPNMDGFNGSIGDFISPIKLSKPLVTGNKATVRLDFFEPSIRSYSIITLLNIKNKWLIDDVQTIIKSQNDFDDVYETNSFKKDILNQFLQIHKIQIEKFKYEDYFLF